MSLSNLYRLSIDCERSANDKARWVDAVLSIQCGILRFGHVRRTQWRSGFWKALASFVDVSVCEGEVIFAPLALGQLGKMVKWYHLDKNPAYNHRGALKHVATCPQCGSMWILTDAMVAEAVEVATRSLEAEGYHKEVRPLTSSRTKR